jgi:hypothetical protein
VSANVVLTSYLLAIPGTPVLKIREPLLDDVTMLLEVLMVPFTVHWELTYGFNRPGKSY